VRLSSLSLRNKLLIFAAALVLVPGVLFGLIAEKSGRDSLQSVIGRQLAREAGHTADRLAAALRTERETLGNFARQDLMREIRVADIDKRISQALTTLRDGSPARVDYLVADQDRTIVASSSPDLIGPLPAWVNSERTASRGEVQLWGPISIPGRHGLELVMTTPIPDPDGSQPELGILVGLFDWTRLTKVIRNVQRDLSEQGVVADVLVARADGFVIGGARSTEQRETSMPEDWAEIVSRIDPAMPDYIIHTDAGLLVGRASLASDLPGWKLLVVEARSLALAPVHQLTQRLLLLMGIALAVALGLAAFAARRVVRPLSELTLAIRRFSHGDVSNSRVPVRSEDEVGTLAAAFNQMASDLVRAQQDLVEAEKFAFVGELASGVAHEVRTSLGVLHSSAQILGRSLPTDADEQTSELAQMIRAEVDRLGGVVDDLLTLDRPRVLQIEKTRLSVPLSRAVAFVEPQAQQKGIEIIRTSPSRDPLVLCDGEMVYQVVVNLLVNALHALSSGGRISITVFDADNGYGGFEIRDDGPGIPEKIRDKIFQPFVTASRGGVGLGLTFVKRVVHDHQGRIAVESSPDSGTCFRIEIPIAGDNH
jgi:two-component system sensor histidine kinase HydH